MISGNVSKTAADTVATMLMNVKSSKSLQVQAPVSTADSFKNVMNMSSGLTSSNSANKTTSDKSLKDISQNTPTGTVADKISSSVKASDKKVNDADKSVVIELSEEIESVVKEKLNMTDEEFSALMSQLGFTAVDLLNPQNLTDFVVAYSGAESSINLLTDSNLSDMYKTLTDSVMQVLQKTADTTGMSVEELTALVEQVQNSNAQTSEDVVNTSQQEINPQLSDVDKAVNVSDEKPVNADEVYSSSRHDNSTADSLPAQDKVTVKTEQTFSSGNNEDMEQSNSKESGSDIMQNLVNSFGKAMETTNVAAQTQVIDAGSIITQIVDAVKVTVTEQTSSMELQLQPENLGKVNIEVIAKDGAVTAKIVAENEAVKSVIENQITALKENMNNQGLKVEAVEVTVASHAFENGMNFENQSNSQQNNPSGSRRFRDYSELPQDDPNETETIQEQIQKANGGSINYTA